MELENMDKSQTTIVKRDGNTEIADLGKIVNAIARSAVGLNWVDPMRVAARTISGIYDGATTKELDELSIRTSASFIAEEPEYSKLAARLLSVYIDKEVESQNLHSFNQSIWMGREYGLINDAVADMAVRYMRKLNSAISTEHNDKFEYFGIKTLYDRYLLRHPDTGLVIETPQYFFLRVACGLSKTPNEAIELYELMSNLDYMPSSPTLFNSGTPHPQLSSCYLLDSPADDLGAIYDKYKDVALLSKFAGGIGLSYSRVRSNGAHIKGTNGKSNGIIPWLKTLDSSVAAVNQGGKRKGAACVYVDTWHADIERFLEMRDNTGDESQRTHNLNFANWVPDIFMHRVENDEMWSLFDPDTVPRLVDTYGARFDYLYKKAEKANLYVKRLPARELYARMMRTLAQTGNGWMTFKDASNKKSNQTANPENVIHLSNLCTEILEVTSAEETAVCNLGSLNLGNFVEWREEDMEYQFNYDRLIEAVATAVYFLDRVIDINYYPIDSASHSNYLWRPVGLGIMGLQDVFFKLNLPFDSEEAKRVSTQIQRHIYAAALKRSAALAKEHGSPHPNYRQTWAWTGMLQTNMWDVADAVVDEVRDDIRAYGLYNSLLIAIAPTATIASITGAYECIEPQVSNIFKRETLSGEFMQINRYLVADLKKLGLWTEEMRNRIKTSEGSIQHMVDLPEEMRTLYRTAWEIPQKALIDLAVARGPYVDQSQSLNLFMADPTIGKLSSMYLYAWKCGLKTTYYLRSRPATRITQTTTSATAAMDHAPTWVSDADSVACSLENPESCEACT